MLRVSAYVRSLGRALELACLFSQYCHWFTCARPLICKANQCCIQDHCAFAGNSTWDRVFVLMRKKRRVSACNRPQELEDQIQTLQDEIQDQISAVPNLPDTRKLPPRISHTITTAPILLGPQLTPDNPVDGNPGMHVRGAGCDQADHTLESQCLLKQLLFSTPSLIDSMCLFGGQVLAYRIWPYSHV